MKFTIKPGYIKAEKFFKLSNHSQRDHRLNILKLRCILQLRLNFFLQRIVTPWNALSDWVVKGKTAGAFKSNYDKWF